MSTGTIKKVAGPLVIAEGMRDANMFDVVRVSKQRLIGEIIEMHGDEASVAPVSVLKDALVRAARNDRCVTYVVHVTDRIIWTRAEINERFRSVLLIGITLDTAFQHDPAVKINIR